MKSQGIDNASEDGELFLQSIFLVLGLKVDGEGREHLELPERLLT